MSRGRKPSVPGERTLGLACQCGCAESRVVETRRNDDSVYRRRRCMQCLDEWLTKETTTSDEHGFRDAQRLVKKGVR